MAFDYELQELVNMRMQGLAVIEAHAISSLNAGKVSTNGQLNLRQPNALALTPPG